MLINREVFSIPPYISTSWGHVTALYMEESTLIVCLTGGITIKIPNLTGELLEKIFEAHQAFLTDPGEKVSRRQKRREPEENSTIEFPFRIGMGMGMGSVESMLANGMQHNPEQAHMPDIPGEILEKITSITKIIAPEDIRNLPKGEPHCNCMFCQVSRAIHSSLDSSSHEESTPTVIEPIQPEEPWIVEQFDSFCYQVYNRDNRNESYKVYIKDGQVGCNCGKHGCEHIIAVLRS